MFSLGGEANYGRRASWPGILKEIVQMFKIVHYINWKRFHYLESSEIEITSLYFFSHMQMFPCDVLRKEFSN